MSNVLPFARSEPHGTGKAFCLGCEHTWEAVAPLGVYDLECPECGTMKGHYTFAFAPPGKLAWSCPCDNQLFNILPDGSIFCPNCGANQTFPKEMK